MELFLSANWRSKPFFKRECRHSELTEVEKKLKSKWEITETHLSIQHLFVSGMFVVALLQAGLYNVVEQILMLCSWEEVAKICMFCEEYEQDAFTLVKTSKRALRKICWINTVFDHTIKYNTAQYLSTPSRCTMNLDRLQQVSTPYEFLEEYAYFIVRPEATLVDRIVYPAESAVPEPSVVAFNPEFPIVAVQPNHKGFQVYCYGGTFRQKMGQIVYSYNHSREYFSLRQVVWSPDGKHLSVFLLNTEGGWRYGLTNAMEMLLFRYHPTTGTMKEVAVSKKILSHPVLTSDFIWIRENEFLCVLLDYQIAKFKIYENRIDHVTVMPRFSTLHQFELDNGTVVDATDRPDEGKNYVSQMFATPDTPNLIYFVLSHCNEGHLHDRICIFDLVSAKLTGFVSLPGLVRKIATLKDRAAVLFVEPKNIRYRRKKEALYSGKVVFNSDATELVDTCPFEAEHQAPRCLYPTRWRIFILIKGENAYNLTTKSIYPLMVRSFLREPQPDSNYSDWMVIQLNSWIEKFDLHMSERSVHFVDKKQKHTNNIGIHIKYSWYNKVGILGNRLQSLSYFHPSLPMFLCTTIADQETFEIYLQRVAKKELRQKLSKKKIAYNKPIQAKLVSEKKLSQKRRIADRSPMH